MSSGYLHRIFKNLRELNNALLKVSRFHSIYSGLIFYVKLIFLCSHFRKSIKYEYIYLNPSIFLLFLKCIRPYLVENTFNLKSQATMRIQEWRSLLGMSK